MLCYLDNLLHISDRKAPFLGQFDTFWFFFFFGLSKWTDRQLPNIKIGVLSAVSCNASLKAIITFDNASLS